MFAGTHGNVPVPHEPILVGKLNLLAVRRCRYPDPGSIFLLIVLAGPEPFASAQVRNFFVLIIPYQDPYDYFYREV